MVLLTKIRAWSDESIQLAQLRAELERIDRRHAAAIERARKTSMNAYESADAERYSESRIPSDQIDLIETARRLRAAHHYGVPVPRRSKDSDYWEWSMVVCDFLLTVEGHQRLRREIAFERELVYKPWLSWIAVGISFVSLIVSVIAALNVK